MLMYHPLLIIALILTLATAAVAQPRVVRVIDVAPVWSGHPVGFALVTHGQNQFVAYYDDQRRMTVASRSLDSDAWTSAILPSSVGWDSHNYIVMTIDDDGHVHLSGNMHGHPLVYFRTTRPLDVTSFQQIAAMVGDDEHRCTYPRFLRGPASELIFMYRIGGSGNGNQIFNVYDHASQTWSRLLDQPLTDGRGQMNAYIHGPVRGPDGFFHLSWVWRDTPDAETNHTLSYARSRDLRNWETGAGSPLALPLTIDNADIVDPIPPLGGILNGTHRIGFDSHKRPIITYHKFDESGFTQAYNARLEDGQWVIYQTSDWNHRWEFSGRGTLDRADVRLGNVSLARGELTLSFWHVNHGSGVWVLDPQTLRPTETRKPPRSRPAELEKPESDFPGMTVRWASDSGKSPRAGITYTLRWETLGPNRDRPHPEPHPEPTMLRLYEIGR